jgi:hypothetical protein
LSYERDATLRRCDVEIPDADARVVVLDPGPSATVAPRVIEVLTEDGIALVPSMPPEGAGDLLHDVAAGLGLAEQLELQAGFAAFLGHRQRIGKYFMSVNQRHDYQFVPPHSEGTGFQCLQLASFYCFENGTDGGETILMNVDPDAGAWDGLRELVVRARPMATPLPAGELARVRALYNLHPERDVLRDDDLTLGERPSKIAGLTLVDALAKPQRAHSRILGRSQYAYWDSIASIDHDSSTAFVQVLRQGGWLKEPPGLSVEQLDSCTPRRIWRSGVDYSRLFARKVVRKLQAGELIIYNNMTWTHTASNWSPSSGHRTVAAAFA